MSFKTVNPNASQNDLLLAHFRKKGSISQMEAQSLYKVRSLTRRITDLKQLGYAITAKWQVDPTGQRYVRYYYAPMSRAAA